MKQTQFDQMLAWTKLAALNSEELLLRMRLGRELTPEEHQGCHDVAKATAEEMYRRIVANRVETEQS